MTQKKLVELLVMSGAAMLEVGGDALIRKGLRGAGFIVVGGGLLVIAAYGLLVNVLELDFARLLGAYVGIFAVIAVGFGWLVFRERIVPSTWLGLAIILLGAMVIQFGTADPPLPRADTLPHEPSTK